MVATKTTKTAQDAASTPSRFSLSMVDESGAGNGPYAGLLYLADPVTGAPITPMQQTGGAVSQNGTWTVGITGGNVGVTGTVQVTGTFWQATQPVSVAALPLPSGAATSAGVSQIVSTLGTPMQQTGGSVTIAGNLPLPTGAATDASVQAITTKLGTSPAQDATVATVATGVGAVTDSAWSGTGSSSLIGGIKAVYGKLAGTLAVSASTLPLPTGAATAANQATQITSEQATAAALGTTADVAWTSGAGSAISLLKKIASSGGGGGGATTVADGADTAEGTTTDDAWGGSGAGTVIGILKAVWTKLGGTLSISAASLPLPSGAATSAAQTTTINAIQAARSGVAPVASSALASSLVLKASPCGLSSLDVMIGAVSGYILVLDATSAPADGTLAGANLPKLAIPIDSNGTSGLLSRTYNPPLLFSTGCVVVFSIAATPFTKTATSNTAFFSAQVI